MPCPPPSGTQGTCYDLRFYSVKTSWTTFQLFNDVMAVELLVSFVFLLISLHANYRRSFSANDFNGSILPMFCTALKPALLVFFLFFTLYLFVPNTGKWTDGLWSVASMGLNWCTFTVIILLFKRPGNMCQKKVQRYSLALSAVLTLFFGVLDVVRTYVLCEKWKNVAEYENLLNELLMVFVFLSTLLHPVASLVPSSYKMRPAAYPFLFGLVLYYAVMAGGSVVLLAGLDGGWCLRGMADLFFFGAYAPVLMYTVREDSMYLRRKASLMENMATASSPLLVNHKMDLGELMQSDGDRVELIDPRNVEVTQRIGYGGSGEVFKAKWRGSSVAVKKFHMTANQTTARGGIQRVLQDFAAEVKVMISLRHPNVLLCMGAIVDVSRNSIGIMTEWVDGGSLFDVIHAQKQLTSVTCAVHGKEHTHRTRFLEFGHQVCPTVVKLLLDTCKGMCYLHSRENPIVHRDLKSSNILVSSDLGTAKICDFGLARVASNKTMTITGTPQWMAPEVLREERYGVKADTYGFGVVMWEMASGRLPFEDLSPMRVVSGIASGELQLELPAYIKGTKFGQLVEDCLRANPDARPTFPKILERLEEIQASMEFAEKIAPARPADRPAGQGDLEEGTARNVASTDSTPKKKKWLSRSRSNK